MHTMKAMVLAAVAGLAAHASSAAAQVPQTTRALGMGGAYAAVARGQEALFLSPGNLGLADSPRWSLALPQVVASGTLRGPGAEFLADVAQFQDLDDARRDEVLAAIPAGGAEGAFNVRAPLFGLSVGPVAVGVTYGAVGGHSAGRDIIELFLDGYQDGRTDYSVGNTVGTRASFVDVAVGYGRRAGPVSVGVTGHYIHGGTLMRSRLFEPRIDVEAEDIEVDYVAVYARGGTGYAVDLGAAYQPAPWLTLTGTVANAFARMTWSEDLRVREFTLGRDLIEEADPQAMLEEYEASETDLDPNGASFRVYETADGLYDEAYFPTTARVGAALSGRYGTHLAASYEKQLTTGRLAGDWEQQLSVGLQQKLLFLGVRAGYSTNLDGATLVAGGVNLGPLDVGVAQLSGDPLAGGETNGVIGTFGLTIRVGGGRR